MNQQIPRESIEFVETKVTLDGATITEGVTIAVTARNIRPAVWSAPTVLEGKIGYLTPVVTLQGEFDVWAKITSTPELPVVYCGRIVRT